MVFIVLPNLLFVFYIYTFEKSFMIYLSVKWLNKLSINQSIGILYIYIYTEEYIYICYYYM